MVVDEHVGKAAGYDMFVIYWAHDAKGWHLSCLKKSSMLQANNQVKCKCTGPMHRLGLAFTDRPSRLS